MIRNRLECLMRKIINKENVIEIRFSGLYNNSYEGGLPYEKSQILGMGRSNCMVMAIYTGYKHK